MMVFDRVANLSRWLAYSTVLIACCVQGQLCPLENTDCSQFGSSCSIVRDDDCSRSLHFTESAKYYPGPVTSFSVITHFSEPQPASPTQRPTARSNVQISWRLPVNGNHKHLQGFIVQILPLKNASPHCFLFNLSQANWDGSPEKYKFLLNCGSLSVNQYDITVMSLPRAKNKDVTNTAIVSVKGNQIDPGKVCDSNLAECWITDLIVYKHLCNDTMNVVFNMAPDAANISYYLIALIYGNSFTAKADATANVSQTKDEHGGAILHIPNNTMLLKDRIIRVIPRGAACKGNVCRISTTEPFDIERPIENECQGFSSLIPGDEFELPQWALVVLIVGSVLLMAVGTAVLVILARRRRIYLHDSPWSETETVGTITITGNSDTPFISKWNGGKRRKEPRSVHTQSVSMKCIYLLYSNDNIFHQNVVGHFANFLTERCSCRIIYDVHHQHEILDKIDWIRQTMDQADYVLVINSEGSSNKCSVLLRNNEVFLPPDCDSGLGDMFVPAFQLLQRDADQESLRNKLILAHFSYTPPQHRLLHLPNMHDKKNYQLMKDIELLYGHIHGSDTYGRTGITDVSYQESKEGHLLSQCIENATGYVESNPCWFEETHGISVPSPTYQVRPELSVATDSMFSELDAINNRGCGPAVPGTNMSASPPEHNGASDCRTSSSSGVSLRWFPYQSALKPPDIPYDTTTLTSSVMGDMIDDINDSHYIRMGSFSDQNKNSRSVQQWDCNMYQNNN